MTDITERLRQLQRVHVVIPEQQAVLEAIAKCHEGYPDGEPSGLLLLGPSWAGKTTVLDLYQSRFHRTETAEGVTEPALRVCVPPVVSLNFLVSSFLEQLGDSSPAGGTLMGKTQRFKCLVREMGGTLLLLDEVENFRGDVRGGRVGLDWLASVANDLHIPFVLAGQPEFERFLLINTGLRRRVTASRRLSPYAWDESEGRESFQRFLATLDEALPFPERSRLSEEGLAYRLHQASGGVPGRAITLVRRAAAEAIREGRAAVTLAHLERAFEDTLVLAEDGENPFRHRWGAGTSQTSRAVAKKVSRLFRRRTVEAVKERLGPSTPKSSEPEV